MNYYTNGTIRFPLRPAKYKGTRRTKNNILGNTVCLTIISACAWFSTTTLASL